MKFDSAVMTVNEVTVVITFVGATAITLVCNQLSGTTQPPTLSQTGNEYWPKGGDALQLQRYGSFHLWIKHIGGR